MKKITAASLALLLALALSSHALAESKEPKTKKDKTSYALGIDLGNRIKMQFHEVIDLDAFLEGYKEGVEGKQPSVSEAEFKTALDAFQKQAVARKTEVMKASGGKNLAEGKKFLEDNAKAAGVKTLTGGVQYKVIKSGSGKASPGPDDTVIVHYEGRTIDGTVFDSSYKRKEPARFSPSQLIKGFGAALMAMKPGDSWEVYIPADMAYGESSPSPAIGPNSVLIFKIEMIEILGK